MSWIKTFSGLVQVIKDPSSNLPVAVLLMAIVTVLVLIAILSLLMLLQEPAPKRSGGKRRPRRAPKRPKHTAADIDEHEYEYPELARKRLVPTGKAKVRPKPTHRRRLISDSMLAWGGVALAIGAVIAWYVSTSGDAFCARSCHAGSKPVESRGTDVHRKVTCTACHERPGVAGVVGAVLIRGVHAVANVIDVPVYTDPVSSQACAKCHPEVWSGTWSDPLLDTKVSHREPLAGGMSCTDCHPRTGHVETTATVGMSMCVRCHDGETAPAECSVCHKGDPSRAVRRSIFSQRLFPRVRLPQVRDCGGCHSQKKCDDCHGLRLPHPDDFIAWRHAKDAAFSRKRTNCFRCHEYKFCTARCHEPFEPAHSSQTFLKAHAEFPRPAGCSCHWAKLPQSARDAIKGDFCAVCH